MKPGILRQLRFPVLTQWRLDDVGTIEARIQTTNLVVSPKLASIPRACHGKGRLSDG
jgi:hypothetical protein